MGSNAFQSLFQWHQAWDFHMLTVVPVMIQWWCIRDSQGMYASQTSQNKVASLTECCLKKLARLVWNTNYVWIFSEFNFPGFWFNSTLAIFIRGAQSNKAMASSDKSGPQAKRKSSFMLCGTRSKWYQKINKIQEKDQKIYLESSSSSLAKMKHWFKIVQSQE